MANGSHALRGKGHASDGDMRDGIVKLLDLLADMVSTRVWTKLEQRVEEGRPVRRSRTKLKAAPLTQDFAITQIIRARMDELGITQAELARRLSVTAPVVSRLLSRPTRAKIMTLQRVADVLDLPLPLLLTQPVGASKDRIKGSATLHSAGSAEIRRSG